MDTASSIFVSLDLLGVFAFALNGSLTAIRLARIDIVGVVTLGIITALGGGMLRDVLLGDTPPATFSDGRYLTVATAGALVAFGSAQGLHRLATPIMVLDAAGLSLFAVSGALKGLDAGIGAPQAVILGLLTAVGGGTLRDVLIREIPAVLTSGLYAVPAMAGAVVLVVGVELGAGDLVAALVGAGVCFAVRIAGVRFGIEAPRPRSAPPT